MLNKEIPKVKSPKTRNPTGKGGFGDNPQNRSPGGWKKEESIGYQYRLLIRMTMAEFKEWLDNNPPEKRTMAQELACKAVFKAMKDLNYLKEITDRTEGKAKYNMEYSGVVKNIVEPIVISKIRQQLQDEENKEQGE